MKKKTTAKPRRASGTQEDEATESADLVLPTEHGFYWLWKGRNAKSVVWFFPYPQWPKAYAMFPGEKDLFYKKDLVAMGFTRFGTKLAPQ